MSGFDKFIDLSQSDCDEFTCGICLGILNNPIETKCCRKTFCKECITSWINSNRLCPNDRQVLKINDLMIDFMFFDMSLINSLIVLIKCHQMICISPENS